MYCLAKSIIVVFSSAPKKYNVTSCSISFTFSLLSSDTEYNFSSVKSSVGKFNLSANIFIAIYATTNNATNNITLVVSAIHFFFIISKNFLTVILLPLFNTFSSLYNYNC